MDYVSDLFDEQLSKFSEEARENILSLKNEFQAAEVKPVGVVANHTHGVSAATRSTASFLIQRIASGAGREVFYYQGSGADARSGKKYSRKYFWLKDLMAPAERWNPGTHDVLAMVDVDYYVDMPAMLLDRVQPYLLYTFVPSKAGKGEGDYKYRFQSDGTVEYIVAGGGSYEHFLWNWDGDAVGVFKTLFGFPIGYVGYAVERRQMDDDHQLILLCPLMRLNWLGAWVAKWKLVARELVRLKTVVGDFVRFNVNAGGSMDVVTGLVGEFASCQIPATVDAAIASTARTVTGKLTLATVKSKMDDGCRDDAKGYRGAEVLLEFHRRGHSNTERVSLVDGVRRFQHLPKGVEPDEDAKPGMTAFMQPLLDGGFVPDITEGNEEQFVRKRVKDIAVPELALDKFTSECIEQFAALLVPDGHNLSPVELEVVAERQNKPSQRAILAEADNGQPTRVTKQFIKREAYSNVNDPRGISQINGVDKRDYSRYIYAFTDTVLKAEPWYAFGKSPREVAERVSEICRQATHVDLTDFSRMDGRVSNIARYLERRVMFRAFKRMHHAEMYELMKSQYGLQARTALGIKYQTDFQRLSGSPETSAFNTLLSAFIAFYTYRRQYILADKAYAMLGIFGGDDGLSAGFRETTATDAASRIGQSLDLVRVKRGDLGVAFLARRYGPDVWYGDSNSCCDLRRQLSKFHLTVNLGDKVTPQVKLREKSFAFALTDANTPILGEFVKKALVLFPPPSEFRNELRIWGVEMDADRQYPNTTADWMDDLVGTELPDFDVTRFRGWLEGADGTTIFNPPRFAESVPLDLKPGRVAVDGDIKVTNKPSDPSREVVRVNGKVDGKPHFRARKPREKSPKPGRGKVVK
jgi:hypothetical protein